jgi:hypothetical protein
VCSLYKKSLWAKRVGKVVDIGGGGYSKDGRSLDGLQAEGFASALAFAGVCLINKHQACRQMEYTVDHQPVEIARRYRSQVSLQRHIINQARWRQVGHNCVKHISDAEVSGTFSSMSILER